MCLKFSSVVGKTLTQRFYEALDHHSPRLMERQRGISLGQCWLTWCKKQRWVYFQFYIIWPCLKCVIFSLLLHSTRLRMWPRSEALSSGGLLVILINFDFSLPHLIPPFPSSTCLLPLNFSLDLPSPLSTMHIIFRFGHVNSYFFNVIVVIDCSEWFSVAFAALGSGWTPDREDSSAV